MAKKIYFMKFDINTLYEEGQKVETWKDIVQILDSLSILHELKSGLGMPFVSIIKYLDELKSRKIIKRRGIERLHLYMTIISHMMNSGLKAHTVIAASDPYRFGKNMISTLHTDSKANSKATIHAKLTPLYDGENKRVSYADIKKAVAGETIKITKQQKECIKHLLSRPNESDSAYGIANALSAKVLGVTMSMNGLQRKTKGKIFCHRDEWFIIHTSIEEMKHLVGTESAIPEYGSEL